MRRIRLTVAYDGTNYCGWQIQPNGITIEEVLNKAICKLTGEEIQVIGASRTDSGVHARGNIAVFDTESRIPAERFSYALNQRLPKDIVVVKSDEVDLNWHPRYQDTLKTYEYHIINTKVPIPTERLYNYFVSFDLDVGQMRRGAAYLEGEHDFAPFCCICFFGKYALPYNELLVVGPKVFVYLFWQFVSSRGSSPFDPRHDPHNEMRGNIQRAPERTTLSGALWALLFPT